MEQYSYSQFTSSNIAIEVAASYSTLFASAAVSSLTEEEIQVAKDFDEELVNQETFNIGGNLPSDDSPAEWQKELADNPAPIHYTFKPIPNLLISQYFPHISDIEKKQSALQSALDEYCSVLARNNTFGIIDCNGYPPDPSLPGKSIVKGLYASNVDNQPKNPYTNGMYVQSCVVSIS